MTAMWTGFSLSAQSMTLTIYLLTALLLSLKKNKPSLFSLSLWLKHSTLGNILANLVNILSTASMSFPEFSGQQCKQYSNCGLIYVL